MATSTRASGTGIRSTARAATSTAPGTSTRATEQVLWRWHHRSFLVSPVLCLFHQSVLCSFFTPASAACPTVRLSVHLSVCLIGRRSHLRSRCHDLCERRCVRGRLLPGQAARPGRVPLRGGLCVRGAVGGRRGARPGRAAVHRGLELQGSVTRTLTHMHTHMHTHTHTSLLSLVELSFNN
jgi:hypothetical protein